MANVWLDTTAPYVLVAVLGAMGWVVNTSVSDLKQYNIVEYEINNVTVDGIHVKYVDIHNRSLTHNLSSGMFTFRCSGMATDDCFIKSDNGSAITFMPISGVSYKSNIGINGPIYEAEARLAPQSAVRYQIRMNSPQDEIVVLYEPAVATDPENSGLIFRSGASWEGWLIANYLKYLIWAFIALAVLLVCWFGGALILLLCKWYRKPGEEPVPEKPETFRVIIEQRRTEGD
ncbi:hypothetical protein CN221_27345 [Sinorhizobium meliloti]|uniref:hypothetical protein n=1 Tax=Rhizobium meliloti TaxID=382 RepID=UPI000FE0AC8E|nr:hypothetical protein [Sinorhizobium meliloti]RVG88453.1 hypothetical protein CN221_27345 [Sinorhizobium meliloti]RVH60016.1 hypothetical protein CN209_25525 [Sinorhizobium meliloti]